MQIAHSPFMGLRVARELGQGWGRRLGERGGSEGRGVGGDGGGGGGGDDGDGDGIGGGGGDGVGGDVNVGGLLLLS